MNKSVDKQKVRAKIRRVRQQLPNALTQRFAHELSDLLASWSVIANSPHIACYLAQDNELSLTPFIQHCWREETSIYLPVLRPLPPNRMWFAPYNARTRLVTNKFRIPEPDVAPNFFVRVSQLTTVLFPLVAFDSSKNRIGMGGGYYDRTFAHLSSCEQRPKFVGVAYNEQQVPSIQSEDWDLPLDAIVTPDRILE